MNDFQLQLQLRLVHFIRMARKKNSFTQKALSTYLNKSISHIERLESTTNPDNFIINTIIELKPYAALMDFSVTDLIGYIEGREIVVNDPLLNKLIVGFERLSIATQVNLIEILEREDKSKIEKTLQISSQLLKSEKNKPVDVSQILKLISEVL